MAKERQGRGHLYKTLEPVTCEARNSDTYIQAHIRSYALLELVTYLVLVYQADRPPACRCLLGRIAILCECVFCACTMALVWPNCFHIDTGLAPKQFRPYSYNYNVVRTMLSLPPQVSLEKSAEASMELDRQREVYREFASAGSTLFFLVETMKVLNHSHSS